MTALAGLDRERAARSVFIALACAFVVAISKALSLPETALSAYLIFFAARREATETAAISMALLVAAFAAVGFAIVLIMATAGAPPLRLAAMFTVAFVAMYLARATSAGVVAAIFGMAIFELLSVMDYLAYPDLVLRGTFWMLTVVFVPMAALLLASFLFGSDARTLLTRSMEERLSLIRRAVTQRTEESAKACRQRLRAGDGETLDAWRRVALRTGRMDRKGVEKAIALQAATDNLLAQCATGHPPADTPANREALALQSGAVADDPLLASLTSPPPVTPATETSDEDVPDDALRFAIKSTIAIGICYAIFLILNWPAIHTITITAFLICLGSTGETLHKATLRIAGCLVGAGIAAFCLLVIVPNLTGVGGLAAMTAFALFPAAWIATGSERISYAGMQIALVFLLSVVNSAGPDVDLGITWGRIVGIILGNLVVAAVFLCLWPTSITGDIRARLAQADKALKQCRPTGMITATLAKARQGLESLKFEPGHARHWRRLSKMTDELEAALLIRHADGVTSLPTKEAL